MSITHAVWYAHQQETNETRKSKANGSHDTAVCARSTIALLPTTRTDAALGCVEEARGSVTLPRRRTAPANSHVACCIAIFIMPQLRRTLFFEIARSAIRLLPAVTFFPVWGTAHIAQAAKGSHSHAPLAHVARIPTPVNQQVWVSGVKRDGENVRVS